MRMKFVTISALALCGLFAGSSARADSVAASLKSGDTFTYSCLRGCGYSTESFHIPQFQPGVFQGSFGDRFFKIENPFSHQNLIDRDRFLEARPAIVPAPEPSSLLLTCLGLVGLGFLTKGAGRRRSLPLVAAS
jgi:hypothetical protein